MRQDLVATFTNGLGATHDWKYNNLKNDLPIPVIKEACELLTTLDIFEENGVKLFDSVVTAKIVTTTCTTNRRKDDYIIRITFCWKNFN